MSEQKHTKEPWKIMPDFHALKQPSAKGCTYHYWRFIATQDFDESTRQGEIIARTSDSPHQETNAQRIVACVNACAGIENPEAFIQNVRDLIEYAESIENDSKTIPASIFRQLRAALAKLKKEEA